MSTIFSKIIAREITAQFVYEDDLCVVIMDKFPCTPGQTLVVPKAEVDYILDLPANLYSHIFSVARRVAKASDEIFGTERTCFVVEGFEVPHVHIKLYPLNRENSLAHILKKTTEKPDDELQKQADKLKAALQN